MFPPAEKASSPLPVRTIAWTSPPPEVKYCVRSRQRTENSCPISTVRALKVAGDWRVMAPMRLTRPFRSSSSMCQPTSSPDEEERFRAEPILLRSAEDRERDDRANIMVVDLFGRSVFGGDAHHTHHQSSSPRASTKKNEALPASDFGAIERRRARVNPSHQCGNRLSLAWRGSPKKRGRAQLIVRKQLFERSCRSTRHAEAVTMRDASSDTDTPTEPFHPALTRKLILQPNEPKRVTNEALQAAGHLLRLFVQEARHRAGIEAECENEGASNDQSGTVDDNERGSIPVRADHISKIAVELLMDFS